jgi:hypothetical protein
MKLKHVIVYQAPFQWCWRGKTEDLIQVQTLRRQLIWASDVLMRLRSVAAGTSAFLVCSVPGNHQWRSLWYFLHMEFRRIECHWRIKTHISDGRAMVPVVIPGLAQVPSNCLLLRLLPEIGDWFLKTAPSCQYSTAIPVNESKIIWSRHSKLYYDSSLVSTVEVVL